MKEVFEERTFKPQTLALIHTMNGILEDYAGQGYVLTVRQLYYQMVATKGYPNNMRAYKRLVNHCGNARKAGLIDWDRLEDTARRVIMASAWDDVSDSLKQLAKQFRIDRWEGQTNRVFVMIEKEALSNVFRGPCYEHHVPLFPNKGYTSLSWAHKVAGWVEGLVNDGHDVTILYFGDHDPSGMDMDRDLTERVDLFSYGTHFDFKRIALTMDQVDDYQPPPNPAKLTDSRAGGYIAEFGAESWELDALSAADLAEMVNDEIVALKDQEVWDARMEEEDQMKKDLLDYAEQWVQQQADSE